VCSIEMTFDVEIWLDSYWPYQCQVVGYSHVTVIGQSSRERVGKTSQKEKRFGHAGTLPRDAKADLNLKL